MMGEDYLSSESFFGFLFKKGRIPYKNFSVFGLIAQELIPLLCEGEKSLFN